ncbi:ferric uptake regulator family protein [Thiolapillus sp.]
MNRFIPCLVLYALLTIPSLGFTSASKATPYFSAPYTGEKVQQYDIELPISRHEKETFHIPNDCSKLNSRLLEGAGHWGNRVERRLWMKADDDCRYLNFLNKYSGKASQDFVTDYDFYNARITDFPLRPGCDLNLLLRNPAACPPPMPGMPNFSMFMSSSMPMHQTQEENLKDCRFENGLFRGFIYHTGMGLRCIRDSKAPGYRILSVDFADVNGDDCQDAILRMVPVGRGARPSLLILPLTRCSDNEKFSLPSGSDYPRFGPAPE